MTSTPAQPPAYPYPYGVPAPQRRKRRVWPWVLLGIVLTPILLFSACAALFVGAATSFDASRQGGTVPLGQTFTYPSGVAITVTAPTGFAVDNPFIVTKKEQAYVSTVTVHNGSKNPVGTALVSLNATVNGAPTERIFVDAPLLGQYLAPGQTLTFPMQFKVKRGTTGPLQIDAVADLNKPIFFTGTL
ncbi:MAG TPA: hypothetical protein VFE65_18665 [Pseudonocardia sp.]|jgi:hypothetical protein|nr:hypothetical protein [Pseudonocardia sp.]